MKIYALLDCNNFYASCERLFEPRLQGKPIVVLSNNDGCVIARSNEAKAIGIKMGEPVFKCELLIRQHKVVKKSANFALYGDLSNRVMQVIGELMGNEAVEVYSIDEAFIEIGDTGSCTPQQALVIARNIQMQVERQVGIPVSIGIARTKLLAKAANKIAKRDALGVYSLYYSCEQECEQAWIDGALADFEVGELWGVGYRYAKFLESHGIRTALDFKYSNQNWVQAQMGVNGARMLSELRNISCAGLERSDERSSKSVICSRSFGKRVSGRAPLEAALANFVAVAASKLRNQGLAAKGLRIYLCATEESLSRGMKLTQACSASSTLITTALELLDEIYQPQLEYKKAGVVLDDLVGRGSVQLSLMQETSVQPILSLPDYELMDKEERISDLVDRLNSSSGVNTIFWGTMVKSSVQDQARASWKAEQNYRSPCYTTDWKALPLLI